MLIIDKYPLFFEHVIIFGPGHHPASASPVGIEIKPAPLTNLPRLLALIDDSKTMPLFSSRIFSPRFRCYCYILN